MVDDRLVTIQVGFYGPSRSRLAFSPTHVNSSGIRLGKSASSLWAKVFRRGMDYCALVYDVNNA